MRDAVKSGKRDRDIMEDDGLCNTACKYPRGLELMRRVYTSPPERTDVNVTFHFGPAGTGKTRCCHDLHAYYFDGNNGFWNGYTGQKKIIFDEFGGHTLAPLTLQRICDIYPFTVNIKGTSAPFLGNDIHICSNYLPIHWWNEKTKFNREAIYRRIDVVHFHYALGKCVFYTSDTKGQMPGCAMEKFELDHAQWFLSPNNFNPPNAVDIL